MSELCRRHYNLRQRANRLDLAADPLATNQDILNAIQEDGPAKVRAAMNAESYLGRAMLRGLDIIEGRGE